MEVSRVVAALSFFLLSSGSLWAFECPVAPGAVTDIQTRSVYVDKKGSIPDARREASNEKIRRPINTFVKDIEEIADSYYQKPSLDKLGCAVGYLEKWAAQRALLGRKVSPQGELVRLWAAGSIGVSVLKLELRPDSMSPQLYRWLSALGAEVFSYVEKREVKSNLYYWAGFSMGVMGLVLENESYLHKSREILKESLGAIAEDGTLPIELGRGQRASLYHAFAAQAIFGLAIVNRSNFAALDAGPFGKLIRLIEKINAEPQYLADKADVKQLHVSRPPWLPLYKELINEKGGMERPDRKLCVSIFRLGGNLCDLIRLVQS